MEQNIVNKLQSIELYLISKITDSFCSFEWIVQFNYTNQVLSADYHSLFNRLLLYRNSSCNLLQNLLISLKWTLGDFQLWNVCHSKLSYTCTKLRMISSYFSWHTSGASTIVVWMTTPITSQEKLLTRRLWSL